jgi:hypothetical protein
LGGNDDRQIEALRDYLLTLGRTTPAPAAAVAANTAKAKPAKR